MLVIGDKNHISEDIFDLMIFYLPFPQKSIRSELAKLFSISIPVALIHQSHIYRQIKVLQTIFEKEKFLHDHIVRVAFIHQSHVY